MNETTGATGASGSTSAGASQNLSELQSMYQEFTQTLTQLRMITTAGQQQMETARAKPQ